jgi:hypothetical protein
MGVDIALGSAASPALLSMAVSLSLGLTSLLLCIEMSLVSLESSPLRRKSFSEPFHDGRSQDTPVKLFTLNVFRAHLRHGFPDLSKARRPALIAPWLAFGPSL